jgi:hypothetical protein
MRLHKKGQEEFFLESLVYILVLVVVLIVLLSYASRISSPGPFDRKKIAIDRAVTVNKLIGVPFDAEIVMPVLTTNITETYSGNTITISDQRGNSEVSYIGNDKYVRVDKGNLTPNNRKYITKIVKEGNRIYFGSTNLTLDSSRMLCTKPKGSRIPNVIIDARKGGIKGNFYNNIPGDPGAVSPVGLIEAEVNLGVATILKVSSGAILTRSDQSRVSVEARKLVTKENPSAGVISFGVGNYSNKSYVPIRAYVMYQSPKYEESKYLACLLVNELRKEFPIIESGSVIPLNPSWMNTNDEYQVINNNGVGVALDLGNMQSDDTVKMLRDNGKIAAVIERVVRMYNEN